MKRKNEERKFSNSNKKRATEPAEPRFRNGLFDDTVLQQYVDQYTGSKPYKHGVIQDLLSPNLLRNVRSEIQENLSFTPKETDIYKIHQSGDLANLDGLDDSSLRLLPSLLVLRDALYSPTFRNYLSTITGSGQLSGRKTDMAINVYTPGCHLLCHDDVIGSRRVSYILYLTDPDKPWKPEWGGALRLYPTYTFVGEDGLPTKSPSPDFAKSIPPAFNQLSFFAVQPGESFHDVEEVYAQEEGVDDDEGRLRMAISGWYHIPQEGEDGFVKGLEEALAEKSSLVQLQGKADRFDFPEAKPCKFAVVGEQELEEEEFEELLKFMAPTYLTPETVEELSAIFAEESSLSLENVLSKKFAARLQAYIGEQEQNVLPATSKDIEKTTPWKVARPPHKHRFLYQQPGDAQESPLSELIEKLLPSKAFAKWLALVTGLKLDSCSALARRFRRGLDYSLATSYEESSPRIEMNLCITPTDGWGGGKEEADANGQGESNGKHDGITGDKPEVGGYEVYMAADEDDVSDRDECEVDDGITGSSKNNDTAQTRKSKADPAIYKSSTGDEEDDSVLFSMPAGWNTISIVLRDTGVLKFVKYVSRAAKGDRWDVTAEYGVVEDSEHEGEETEEKNELDN
ncbi:MAG: hypothetical protein M1812_001675 [Candelaria pacifica]|nr:MAG: hypothetical protein M1812_001675 [Candelaria pacifica]